MKFLYTFISFLANILRQSQAHFVSFLVDLREIAVFLNISLFIANFPFKLVVIHGWLKLNTITPMFCNVS
jgi:hypothetical protein